MFSKLMKILNDILQALQDIHYHLDRYELMYMYVNKVQIQDTEKGKEIKIKK